MSVETIKFANGKILQIIEGEYVIGAGGACKEKSCLKGNIINGEYWVNMCNENKKCSNDISIFKDFLLYPYISKIDKIPENLNFFKYKSTNTCTSEWYIDENGQIKSGADAQVEPPICLFGYDYFTGTNGDCGTDMSGNRTMRLSYCFSSDYCEDFYFRLKNGDVFTIWYDENYFYLPKGIVTIDSYEKGRKTICNVYLKVKRLCKGL